MIASLQMILIEDPKEMQDWSVSQRKEGKRIAFVPTMGALHEGHITLLKKGRELGDKLVLSLFVNPTQFGPTEDFEKYPRDKEGDLAQAKSAGVDCVFCPTVDSMYPKGSQTYVEVERLSQPLCSSKRPGHFRGVATIVLKLFNIMKPHVALFGEKDFQQLKIIQRMVLDLNLPVEIIPMPIVRERDGLAMSSRNKYLTPDERKAALKIFQSLQKAKEMVSQGIQDTETILKTVREILESTNKIQIDYISLCDPETLEGLKLFKLPALLAVACYVGKTRLIDNCLLVHGAPFRELVRL